LGFGGSTFLHVNITARNQDGQGRYNNETASINIKVYSVFSPLQCPEELHHIIVHRWRSGGENKLQLVFLVFKLLVDTTRIFFH